MTRQFDRQEVGFAERKPVLVKNLFTQIGIRADDANQGRIA